MQYFAFMGADMRKLNKEINKLLIENKNNKKF